MSHPPQLSSATKGSFHEYHGDVLDAPDHSTVASDCSDEDIRLLRDEVCMLCAMALKLATV